VIDLGPADTTVCIYATVMLDAGNEGSSYYWSNGSTEKTVEAATAGIGYDEQTYKVKVINQYACVDSSSIHIIFSFSACTGIGEETSLGRVRIWPNPATAVLNVEFDRPDPQAEIRITDIRGVEKLHQVIGSDGSGIVKRTFNLEQYPAGLYIVRVKSSSFVKTLKFIKH
jgi:hypothetical protein